MSRHNKSLFEGFFHRKADEAASVETHSGASSLERKSMHSMSSNGIPIFEAPSVPKESVEDYDARIEALEHELERLRDRKQELVRADEEAIHEREHEAFDEASAVTAPSSASGQLRSQAAASHGSAFGEVGDDDNRGESVSMQPSERTFSDDEKIEGLHSETSSRSSSSGRHIALTRTVTNENYINASRYLSNPLEITNQNAEQDERNMQRVLTHAMINWDNVHEEDEYKYPLDNTTGCRIVVFLDNDPDDPRNMPKWRKWMITVILGLICFGVAFSSAVVTGDIKGVMNYFQVSEEVVILTVTLFVVGFAVGPIFFAPASEEYGRQIVYVSTFIFAIAFIVPCAVARNIGTLLVCRFIDGTAFSAPMTVIGGSLADIWDAHERGIAMAVFSAAPFIGPALGPLIGGFIGDYMYWRWIYWIMMFLIIGVSIPLVLFVPETHHNTILRRRATRLIKLTGDVRYKTLKDVVPTDYAELIKTTLLKPWRLLIEPIVALMTLYMTMMYGLLYMFFFAYPVVFNEGKGWPDHKTGLMFIPLAIGILIGAVTAPFVNRDYVRRAKKYEERGEVCPPEIRLIPMMIGCWMVPIGMFIFAWTSYPRLIWVGPALGGFPVGIGFILLYNSVNNYLVDSYTHCAASAIAAKTIVRSLYGAGCVLFTVQMYHTLGYEWAGSLLAFISLGLCLIPYFFWFCGAKVRTWSKYAYSPGKEM